jgi:alcohol dehydrogenase class IV
MDLDFFMPVKIISGSHCMDQGAKALRALSDQCLIVTGASSAKKSGALDDAIKVLQLGGISYEIFDKVGQNPLVSVCRQAGAAARGAGAGFIFGIGGGSALDAAKAAAVFAANPGLSQDAFFALQFRHRALPIVLAGTTAGTGSEVTAVSVLTMDDCNQKKSVTHPDCYARIAFANPRYTDSCPYGVTVSTALDALSHAIEGYYSVRGGDASANFALKAMNLITPQLKILLAHPDELPQAAGRYALYFGSLWAGLALNLSGTGFPHPAGYFLTSNHGIPHGIACAFFLPDYLRHNASAEPVRTKQLIESTGCGIDTLCEIIDGLVGQKPKLTPAQCEEYARLLHGRANLANAVNPSTCEEIRGYYLKLFC